MHERLGKAATELAKTLEGDAVIGPVVADISEGSYSLRCAMAGLDALPAWPGAPRPVQANDLLPERVFAGDELAKAQLFEQIYKPLHALGSTIEETIYTYLLSGLVWRARRGLCLYTPTRCVTAWGGWRRSWVGMPRIRAKLLCYTPQLF